MKLKIYNSKKNFFLLNLLCLLSFSSIGQTTYTSASFPLPGDILKISTTTDSLLTVTPASATATAWDFSYFVATNTFNDTIEPASTGASFASFPTTEVLQPLLGNQFGIAYTDVDTFQIERLGGGLEFFGISFISPYDDTHITQIVPLTYPDVASDQYALKFSEHIDSIPFLRPIIDTLLLNIPGGQFLSVDSIRFAIIGDEDRSVDAWGTCQMADSTYDVIRQKVVTNFSIRVELYTGIPFIGPWTDVTTFISALLPFPTQGTTVNYNFLSEGVKQPIVSLFLDSAETTIINIEYIDTIINNPPNTIDVRYLEDELTVSIFPNPANDLLNIQMAAGDVPTKGYRLHVVDMLGRIALTENNIFNESHQINVSTIINGHYVIVLQDDNGVILKRQQVEILR